MINLLETTELFNWTIPVMFFHVPESLSNRMMLILRRKAGNKVHTHTDTYTLYTMDKTLQKNIPLRYTALGLGAKFSNILGLTHT